MASGNNRFKRKHDLLSAAADNNDNNDDNDDNDDDHQNNNSRAADTKTNDTSQITKKQAVAPLHQPLDYKDEGDADDESKEEAIRMELPVDKEMARREAEWKSEDWIVKTCSAQQQQPIRAVQAGKNVFITGSGGCGKTYIYQILKRWCAEMKKSVAFTAYTGKAATLISGNTLHAFLGAGVQIENTRTKQVLWKIYNSGATSRWVDTQILFIDETSMVPKLLFEKIDELAREIRSDWGFLEIYRRVKLSEEEKREIENRKTLPFGGLQIVVSGDFGQLGPMPSTDWKSSDAPSKESKRPKFSSKKPSKQESTTITNPSELYAFKSPLWEATFGFSTFCLTKSYRQADEVFKRLLNNVRINQLDRNDINLLKSLVRPMKSNNICNSEPSTELILYSVTAHVAQYNAIEMKKLTDKPGVEIVKYDATTWISRTNGDATYLESFIDNMNTHSQVPAHLELCEGAKVMLLRNLSVVDGLINGAIGFVTKFINTRKDGRCPVVKFKDLPSAPEIVIHPFSWEQKEDEQNYASWTQIPLVCAWAMTVNKAQGSSCKYVYINTNRMFGAGRFYTALSRATTLEGAGLSSFNRNIIKVDPEVAKYIALTRPHLPETLRRRLILPANLPDVLVDLLVDYLVY